MDSEEVRSVSHSLYGNRYFLEVSATIAAVSQRTTTQKELAALAQIDKSLVALVVSRLLDAGLLRRSPGDGRERPLLPKDSVFWQLAADLLRELRDA